MPMIGALMEELPIGVEQWTRIPIGVECRLHAPMTRIGTENHVAVEFIVEIGLSVAAVT